MKNVVYSSSKKTVGMFVLIICAFVMADHFGEFNCGSCDPTVINDADTLAFIHHDVKEQIFVQNGGDDDGDWDANDTVTITNSQGQSAIWGRLGAFGPISMINIINNCGVSCESHVETPIDENEGPFNP